MHRGPYDLLDQGAEGPLKLALLQVPRFKSRLQPSPGLSTPPDLGPSLSHAHSLALSHPFQLCPVRHPHPHLLPPPNVVRPSCHLAASTLTTYRYSTTTAPSLLRSLECLHLSLSPLNILEPPET